ncbi:sodium/hydrogen exchanger family protein [Skeletonema marinoi]|uniref:Sodium/hydrogen exchanger family protein n=1 Tax=Skeletonema marinoi TaxID=267567 RepID=A0AAD8YEX1_9STRA|nr:sodium/hydrogen exchanger family protein [Skeletonema marinoi]
MPYTAIMFIVGAIMGFCSTENIGSNAVTESTKMWIHIDGEVLLLAFLPGLLFLDSYNTNVYLFKQAISQLLVFAFPMGLCGTILTALVAYFVLPYGWSTDLCMLLGSILAATDPVAVAVLLNELGAPPRLRTHIAGESLLNDGAAVVFFKIFSARFFHEMGVDGVGEEIGWSRGIVLFLRLSLGGAVVGVLFGVLLVMMLFNLNRHLRMLVEFDSFTLGGAVWASIIPDFTGSDWLYLLILYTAVIIIRFVLMALFFPLTSRIGVGQNMREMIFQSWGGLRGAVGIALALLLSKEVVEYSEAGNLSEETRHQYQQYVQKLFGMVGGVACLSLIIAGPSSGPLLRVLGLITPSETRSNVVSNHEKHLAKEYLSILSIC